MNVEITRGVATLTADLTPLSAHDPIAARALRDAVVELSDDDHVKALVIRSSGPDFCLAAESAGPAQHPTAWEQDFAAADALYQSLTFSKKVTITEVDGVCAGAGALLVLASDLTIASHRASFGSPFASMPEANLVLAALTMRLNRAKAWALQGTVLTADEALEAGLVNRVVPAGALTAAVSAMAQSVTGMPLDGVTMSKMLLQSVLDSHGVGREFDMAPFYAASLWAGAR
jgi:enoyl-CoA hydratase/carnithine racemase